MTSIIHYITRNWQCCRYHRHLCDWDSDPREGGESNDNTKEDRFHTLAMNMLSILSRSSIPHVVSKDKRMIWFCTLITCLLVFLLQRGYFEQGKQSRGEDTNITFSICSSVYIRVTGKRRRFFRLDWYKNSRITVFCLFQMQGRKKQNRGSRQILNIKKSNCWILLHCMSRAYFKQVKFGQIMAKEI